MLFLALLDFGWSLAALLYDWSAIMAVPIWAWVFIVIYPLYPLLLGVTWLWLWRKKHLPDLLLAFASLPASVYGILALVFYPLCLYYEGFSWLTLLQIPWVLFYGVQGWFLLKKYPLSLISISVVSSFIDISLFLQYRFHSFGYLGVDVLPASVRLGLFITSLVVTVCICLLAYQKTLTTEQK